MTPRMTVISIIISLSIMFGIVELVRRRKLQEEYSFLWLITGLVLFLLTVRYQLLVKLTQAIGVVTPINTLFFFGFIFVLLLCLHYSLRISQLATQVKILAQKLALMEAEKTRKADSG